MLSATHGHNLSNVMARPIPSYGFLITPTDYPAIGGSDIARAEVTAARLALIESSFATYLFIRPVGACVITYR